MFRRFDNLVRLEIRPKNLIYNISEGTKRTTINLSTGYPLLGAQQTIFFLSIYLFVVGNLPFFFRILKVVFISWTLSNMFLALKNLLVCFRNRKCTTLPYLRLQYDGDWHLDKKCLFENKQWNKTRYQSASLKLVYLYFRFHYLIFHQKEFCNILAFTICGNTKNIELSINICLLNTLIFSLVF